MQFVVTAGPTREYLDPVRFLSNPSTGRMGFALAAAARAAGHGVTLVAGPVALATPRGVRRLDVVSARDMLAAVCGALDACLAKDEAVALVMSAAVADWRPKTCAAKKLKKGAMSNVLHLVRNPDILKTLKRRYATCGRGRLVRIGFAAETGEPTQEAARKLRAKGLDCIVANDVTRPGAGFGTATNVATLVFPDGRLTPLPLMRKTSLARRIVAVAEDLVAKERP